MKISPEKVKEVLFASTEDLGEAGIDLKTGRGRVTTDFIDVGRIVDDDTYQYQRKSDLTGCEGIATGVIVALMIWILIIIL